MAEAGPEPGTELNRGEPTKPRQAATVILLRGGAERLEVLLVRRSFAARFMAGVWVFPGGAVDAGEDERAAAQQDHRRRLARCGRRTPGVELLARPGAGNGHQSSSGEKSALRAPQTGQNQSLGMSSNAVPAGMPPSGSPSAGS